MLDKNFTKFEALACHETPSSAESQLQNDEYDQWTPFRPSQVTIPPRKVDHALSNVSRAPNSDHGWADFGAPGPRSGHLEPFQWQNGPRFGQSMWRERPSRAGIAGAGRIDRS